MNTKNFANKTFALLVACGAIVGVANSAMAQTPATGVVTFNGSVASGCSFVSNGTNSYAITKTYTPTTIASGETTQLTSSDNQAIICNTANPTVTLALSGLASPGTGVTAIGTAYNHNVQLVFAGVDSTVITANADGAIILPGTFAPLTIPGGSQQPLAITSTFARIGTNVLPAGAYHAVLTYTVAAP